METLEQKIKRVTSEKVEITPYNPQWPEMFEQEKAHLLACLPRKLIKRIEHFGSTAIPGMAAKPIIDILVKVTSLDKTKEQIVPVLEAQGYEYFWRPTVGDDTPTYYAWFIKRDSKGKRTHHIHMVEKDFDNTDELLFRDYLMEHPQAAAEYQGLKLKLANEFPNDRVAYTEGKTEFITKIMETVKKYYRKG